MASGFQHHAPSGIGSKLPAYQKILEAVTLQGMFVIIYKATKSSEIP